MKAIAACDKVALEFDLLLLVDKVDAWLRRSHIRHLDVRDVEKNRATLCETCGDKIFQDFMLRIKRDGASIGQPVQINAVCFAIKAEFYAMMNGAFALHTLAEPHFRQQIDGALFENPGTNR